MQDPRFLQFLEKVGRDRVAAFSTHDLLVLDLVRREQPIPADLRSSLQALAEEGIIEAIGRGRGARYLLSQRYYQMAAKGGVYTRKRGLDRGTNKALLLKHLQDNAEEGSPISELQQVLPAVHRRQLQRLLAELREEGQVRRDGSSRSARWYPDTPPGGTMEAGGRSGEEQE